MPYCPLCGTQNFAGGKYCANCGINLTGETGHLLRHTVLEGRYVIIEALGRGGMGAVYKALDQRLGRAPVAIKEMSSGAVRSGDLQASIESFKKEASILVNLRHHALPRVIDFFSAGEGRWYLVMDYIEGKTLREVLEKRGPIPESEVLDWAGQICEILDYLHSQNLPVIFRDLKPSNIMLTPEGKIKLIDFGIARNFSPGLTSDTSAYGSPGYSPPEQHGQRQTDARSDIYALGATLHHLLTGVDPRKSPFIFEPPSKLVNISAEFESVIMKALEFKPENRIASIKEMISLLPAGAKSHFNWSGPLTLTGSVPKLDQNMTDVTDPVHDEENSEQQSSSAGWDETVDLWQTETANVIPEGREDTPETAGDFNYSYLAETQEVKSREGFPRDGNPGGRSGWIKKIAAAAGLVLLLAAGAYGYSHQVANNKTANNSQNQTAAVKTQQTEFQPHTQQQAQPFQYQQLNDQQLQKQQEELQRQQEELQQRQQNLETQKQQELIRQQEELRRQQEELQKLQQNKVTTQQQQEEIQRQQEEYQRQQEELQRQQEEYQRQQEEIRRQQEEYQRQQEEYERQQEEQRQQEEYERQLELQRQQEEYERQLELQRQQEELLRHLEVPASLYVASVPFIQKMQQDLSIGPIIIQGSFAGHEGTVQFAFPSGISILDSYCIVADGDAVMQFNGIADSGWGCVAEYSVVSGGTVPGTAEFYFTIDTYDSCPTGDLMVDISGSSGFWGSLVLANVYE